MRTNPRARTHPCTNAQAHACRYGLLHIDAHTYALEFYSACLSCISVFPPLPIPAWLSLYYSVSITSYLSSSPSHRIHICLFLSLSPRLSFRINLCIFVFPFLQPSFFQLLCSTTRLHHYLSLWLSLYLSPYLSPMSIHLSSLYL